MHRGLPAILDYNPFCDSPEHPDCQSTLSVRLITLGDKTQHHCCVFHEVYDCICVMEWCAVMGVQRAEEGAQHTALWCPCAE